MLGGDRAGADLGGARGGHAGAGDGRGRGHPQGGRPSGPRRRAQRTAAPVGGLGGAAGRDRSRPARRTSSVAGMAATAAAAAAVPAGGSRPVLGFRDARWAAPAWRAWVASEGAPRALDRDALARTQAVDLRHDVPRLDHVELALVGRPHGPTKQRRRSSARTA